jgi:hypothetical protein
MNPVACAKSLEPQRRFFCKHYDTCLDMAVIRNWPSFTCGICTDFHPFEWATTELEQDMLHCTALVSVLFSPKSYKGVRVKSLIDAIGKPAEHEEWL